MPCVVEKNRKLDLTVAPQKTERIWFHGLRKHHEPSGDHGKKLATSIRASYDPRTSMGRSSGRKTWVPPVVRLNSGDCSG